VNARGRGPDEMRKLRPRRIDDNNADSPFDGFTAHQQNEDETSRRQKEQNLTVTGGSRGSRRSPQSFLKEEN